QRLARSGWADQKNIRLGEFDFFVLGLMFKAFVMVVNRDRQHLLRIILPDDVVVEDLADFLWRRNAVTRLVQRLGFLPDDILAQLNAFIADEHRRPGDQLTHLVLALAAERAIEGALCFLAGDLAHSCLPSNALYIQAR